ncbi:uncharacterized protein SAPINGB_P002130 [Magnusiomyces paraingens]|uniref:Barstar (barnase inhibitor) domain-containing protein n=1 Tax=Magnusiomyces paraingens TaxID=2606893 RepID=A0A5E8BKB6_9ASCO|nr:uncharacterized protein SAPINGB_P002130 [Saprochaete ingens]VVT49155.1 unnamed protein product [Saprochaete ingens]
MHYPPSYNALSPAANGVTFLLGHPNHELMDTLLLQYNRQRGWTSPNTLPTNNTSQLSQAIQSPKPAMISLCSAAVYHPGQVNTPPAKVPLDSRTITKLPSPKTLQQPQTNLYVHLVEIAARDVYMLGPSNSPALANLLFHKLCTAFEVPEYYGYHFDTLYHFLSDLSWLSPGPHGHVLIFSIISADNSYGRGGLDSGVNSQVSTQIAMLDFVWRMLDTVAREWATRGVTFHTFVTDRSPYAAATRVRL